MKKLERVQTKNGTKATEKSTKSGYTAPKQPKVLKTLQVSILGKGWVSITAPTTDKIIAGVKRYHGFKYRLV